MASLTQSETLSPEVRALALALDAIEAELAGLEPGASADIIARRLAAPVRAFDAAAKASLGGKS
ncbi:MAG TPA: hypothetical protein PLK37_05985 [Terricaulis sp.]|nr:hypothetical protein [Terricaulis sp.]